MTVIVEQVPFRLVLPLRQRVLRPHQRIVEVGFAGDEEGTHFAAFDESGALVGVASLLPDLSTPDLDLSWRLRGMAVDLESQGKGVGSAIMSTLLEFASHINPGGIWCAARMPAVGFYEQFGFKSVGEAYVEPDIGAHIRMERRPTPSARLSSLGERLEQARRSE